MFVGVTEGNGIVPSHWRYLERESSSTQGLFWAILWLYNLRQVV